MATDYQPQPGDETIIYINRFSTDNYEQGKKLIIEEFSKALQSYDEVTITQFYSNPATLEVGAIQFFRDGSSSVEKWLNSQEREAILEQLIPLCSEPLIMHRVTLDVRTHGG